MDARRGWFAMIDLTLSFPPLILYPRYKISHSKLQNDTAKCTDKTHMQLCPQHIKFFVKKLLKNNLGIAVTDQPLNKFIPYVRPIGVKITIFLSWKTQSIVTIFKTLQLNTARVNKMLPHISSMCRTIRLPCDKVARNALTQKFTNFWPKNTVYTISLHARNNIMHHTPASYVPDTQQYHVSITT